MNGEPYDILTGVGKLYLAVVGTDFPDLDVEPGEDWRYLGETVDGVTVTYDQTIEKLTVDQETGGLKPARTEESAMFETKLARATLENLADVLGTQVTDTPAGVTTIGTRAMGQYRGFDVAQYAFLFRGTSPYGDWPAQYQLPRGYFDGSQALEHTKGGQVAIPVQFQALVDLNAASDDLKFGELVAQDAVATG